MYLLPVAALAMASCSNSDDPIAEVNVPKLATADQLMIRPAMAGASTRVAKAYDNAADITSFKLIATGNFLDGSAAGPGDNAYDMSGGIDITGDGSGSVWNFPTEHQYVWWGDATTKATFTAYAPTNVPNINAEQTISNDLDQQLDYIVAYNEGMKGDFKTGVPLNFQHATSQIVVKAVNKNTSAVTIKVKGTRMVNVISKGTLSLPTVATNGSFSWDNTDYTPWTLGNATDTYADTYDNAVLLEESNPQVIGNAQYLLPQQLTAATTDVEYAAGDTWNKDVTGNAIAFLIQVNDGTNAIYPVLQEEGATLVSQGYAWAYVPVDTDWQPGRKYTYTINFAEDAYGKVDPNQGDEGTPDPKDKTPNDSTDDEPEQKPGEEVKDSPLRLTFTVSVEDWTPMAEPKNL